MSKRNVLDRFCDLSVSIKEQSKGIDIDEFVFAPGHFVFSGGVVYGVNVRLNSQEGVLPFIHSNVKGFSPKLECVDPSLTIPSFCDELKIKEIDFDFHLNSFNEIEVTWYNVTYFDGVSPTITCCKDISDILNRKVIRDGQSYNSFLFPNIKALDIESVSCIRVWITAEDYDLDNNAESFLSNIMAISPEDRTSTAPSNIQAIQDRRDDILQFLFLLKARYALELNEKRLKAAEKSAKAAIMSRNMSHNLGSHVMAYLKQKLGSVASILNSDSDVLYSLYSKGSLSSTLDVEMPFLVGLGRFIGYLQERQDYIATIATDYIPYGAPVNFKDAIYDELNPDLRYIRHKDDGKNRPFNILLNYIAKSEGLSRENMVLSGDNKFSSKHDILFGLVDYVRNKTLNKIDSFEFGIIPAQCESNYPAMKKMRETNFSLPGGLIGRQALFSIIENLIRNAAKHGDIRSVKDGNLSFTFDIIDGRHIIDTDPAIEPFLNERIYDEKWRELYQNATDRDDLLLITITDNLDYHNNSSLARRLRDGIIEKYIDDVSGKMTDSNKGIKEIRISAAWLREETDENRYFRYGDSIDRPKLAPLVAIEFTKDFHLRYIIALKKNKHVAVIIDKNFNSNDADLFMQLSLLFPNDWTVFKDANEFLGINDNNSESCSKQIKVPDSYQYIIVYDNATYNRIRPYSSNRILIWDLPESIQAHWDPVALKKALDKNKWEVLSEKERDDVLSQIHLPIYELFTRIHEGPDFYIWDGSARDNHKDSDVFRKIKVFDTDKYSEEALYAYRTHHSAEKNFTDYWITKHTSKNYSRLVAIDGITGDNSSDRLVRREPLNEQWYFSHLYALQKRVAVFDERLFRIIHAVNEADFITDFTPGVKDILDRLKSSSITTDEAIEALSDTSLNVSIIEELYGKNKEDIINTITPHIKSTFSTIIKEGNHLSAYNHEKNVDIYTIIKDENGDYSIIGMVKCDYVDESKPFRSLFDRVATISSKTGRIEPINEYESLFMNKYDYISIHQGILDKIYTGRKIKQHNNINDIEKCKITESLYKLFMNDVHTIPLPDLEAPGDFLPRFIIHSGRSKPTVEDMPQHQPFVQYAAIEHGVKDSKYSLVEILDFARYEPNND